MGHNEGGYLPYSVVKKAAAELRAADLRRKEAKLLRWLALKWWGLREGKPVSFTTADAERFADAFVNVNANSALDFRTYLPFTGRWNKSSGTSAWYIQTFWSQLRRMPEAGKLYEAEEVTGTSRLQVGGQYRVTHQVAQKDAPEYLEHLESEIGGQVPLAPLAIWRYRERRFEEAKVLEDSLAGMLVAELGLTEEEQRSVFGRVANHSTEVSRLEEVDTDASAVEQEGP